MDDPIVVRRRPFIRRCNGGPDGPWCGARATMLCSQVLEPGEPYATHTAQWFACDAHAHDGNATAEPLPDWLERHGLEPQAPDE